MSIPTATTAAAAEHILSLAKDGGVGEDDGRCWRLP
jgi:hypothetical protein